jgi:hypothetical protein
MNKVKYIVSGITIGRLEHMISQLKNPNNEGIVVLADDLPTSIIEIGESSVKTISFGEFIAKVINIPLQKPEAGSYEDLRNTSKTIENELERHFLNRED